MAEQLRTGGSLQEQALAETVWTIDDQYTYEVMSDIVKTQGQVGISDLVKLTGEQLGIDPEDKNTNIRHVLWMGIGGFKSFNLSTDRKISLNEQE